MNISGQIFVRSLIKVLDGPDKKEPKKGRQLLPGGFAGTGPNGSFFEAPAWVDQSKAPGTTSQVRQPAIIVYSEEKAIG